MTDLRPPEQTVAYEQLTGAVRTLYALHEEVNGSPLDRRIVELVRIRASQLNHCAFCLDMHTRDAVAHGETDDRLTLLPAWREAGRFDARERAALALTEALSSLEGGVDDEAMDACTQLFDQAELSGLLFAIAEINSWNRLNVASRKPVPEAAQ